eukprot:TRINITY_DN42673_c0_g1_i1.p1 TRINITY_DN42673_c0_g1~~TRINITY_DN42673_c0_g1_i1.p1  ORF type:complete len:312 (-),score=63.37 TRINITY_DN42673_c0_g1_i1:115-1050(-)
MVVRELDVANIRFTQEHVYDSFNANSEKAGNVVELIEAILRGEKTPRDLPLIRVAAKQGAYWCVDNRRLFVYKHCQLGPIPVEVYDWKDNREFELKWRNGRATRKKTNGGRRAGMIQRTDLPFPRSPVAEESLSSINRFLDQKSQKRHEERIAALRRRREAAAATGEVAAGSSLPCGASSAVETSASTAMALRRIFVPPEEATAKKKKGKKRSRGGACQGDRVSTLEESTVIAPVKEPSSTSASRVTEEAPRKKKRRRTKVVDDTKRDAKACPPHVSSGMEPSTGLAKLTVTVGGEESDDEAYAVELFAPG